MSKETERLKKDCEQALKNLSLAARAYTRAFDDYMEAIREDAKHGPADKTNS